MPGLEESSENLVLPAELRGLELDPAQAARDKARRLHRLNTVTVPALRFVGFGVLSFGIYLYLRFFEHQADAARIAWLYAVLSLGYCVLAAAVLRSFRPGLAPVGEFRRTRVELWMVFLAFDVILHIVAIYLTGGENSWLVALLLLRVADQATSGQKRALFFAHFNVLCFLGLTLYLDLGEGRAIDWQREATKAGLLYASGWWIALSARGGDRRRRQVSAAIDATRRLIRKLERQTRRLNDAKALAEAANQAKSQFLANMSHELRSPLSGVIGIAELLAEEDLSADHRRLVAQLLSSAGALLHLVDDILDFARIEAGKLSVERVPCRLSSVVDDVARLLDHQVRRQQVALRQAVPDHLPPVLTDPARLRQVLLNLMGNAVKFSPGGTVEVRLSELHRDGERLRIRLEIEDTGIGIAEEDQPNLFEPFTQVDASSSRRYGGTGLGLAIALSLVELMGGRIGVDSRLGEGSVFWFELRLRLAAEPEAAASRGEPASLSGAAGAGPRVLLVEDNPVAAVVAAGILRHLGAEVETVDEGHAAVTAASRRAFDLILMDCQMPGMDGFQATREIRRRERETESPSTPIVALTAHALAEDRNKCLAAGMDDHLPKPVRRDALARTLAAWCRPVDN